jgi:hypothetical protein
MLPRTAAAIVIIGPATLLVARFGGIEISLEQRIGPRQPFDPVLGNVRQIQLDRRDHRQR